MLVKVIGSRLVLVCFEGHGSVHSPAFRSFEGGLPLLDEEMAGDPPRRPTVRSFWREHRRRWPLNNGLA